MIVTDLITHCSRMIGYLGRGQSLTAAESNAGLDIFNELNESWNRESLMIFRTIRSTVTWAASASSRTIGAAGAQITLPRPDRIIAASWVDTSVTPNLEVSITVLDTIQQYQSIPQKTLESTWPLLMYYDATITGSDGTIYIWPVPSSAITVALYLWGRMTTAWLLTDTITMPDGYQRMMRYNLALELCGVFNMPIPDYVLIGAEDSKANIKSLNMTARPIACDPLAVSGPIAGGVYNWRSDTWG